MGNIMKVLIWKHLMVRLRRFIHTPVEFLSPIIFFLIIFSFKNNINPPRHSYKWEQGSSEPIETEPFSIDDVKLSRVLYTPDTPLTKQLMVIVGEKLGLQHYVTLPEANTKGYYPINNLSLITEDFIIRMSSEDAIVIFQDMTGDTWPKRLNYTIRMKRNFGTNIQIPLDGMSGVHQMFGRIYEPFMRLQWAIDTSFIQTLTNSFVNQELTLQEFPYPISGNTMEVMQIICIVLMVLCWMSLLLTYVFLTSRLLEERTTGIQELIKMVGVPPNLLGVSHFLNTLPAGVVYSIVGTILLTATSNPIIPETSPILVFIMLALHFVTVVAMAFACSYFVKSTRYAVTISIFMYVLLWTPTRLVFGKTRNSLLVIVSGLLPHMPMQWFWNEVASVMQYGHGISFTDAMSSHSYFSGSVFLCYVFMLIQCALFFALAWYLSLVSPGNYGQALPWNFIFQKQYWNKQIKPDDLELEEQEEKSTMTDSDPQFFEEPPKDLEVGIKIVNVSKMFPKHRALNNVSMDVYKGEITVLVGHNGAGKTTLMSIITGMYSATEGKVYVNGLDTATQANQVRRQIGLCPQHNLFFPDLTVQEHVVFFTMLKGSGYSEAKQSSKDLLSKLGLWEKVHSRSSTLSGGMKRRLQLACALAGGADVLILDEPTSGLDVQTRRELWDLLLSLRGSRTVLLTTHFMEEADALGSRVAALHAGSLRCHATPMHLKKAMGTGYRLSFTTIGIPNEPAITSLVTSHVPDATVKEKSLNSISYNLPSKNSAQFPELFTTLETSRSQLGIDSIGVGISTLEEVFLKLCSDVDTTFSSDDIDKGSPEQTMKKDTGLLLYVRQLHVLLLRQWKYLMSMKISFLILQIVIPIVMICMFTKISNNELDLDVSNVLVSMNLNMYKDIPDKKALYNVNASAVNFKRVSDVYSNVDFERASDIPNTVLRSGAQDLLEYNKYLVGVEINDTSAKVFFTTTVRHAAPVALNLLSNLLTTQYLPYADGKTISTFNYPLEETSLPIIHTELAEPKSQSLTIMWELFIMFIILATNINCVTLPCKERVSGARHAHVMGGCPPALYWAATLLAHLILCVVTLLIPTVIAAATLDTDHTISRSDALAAIFFTILLGSLAFYPLMYLVSFCNIERTATIVLAFIVIVFGFVTPTMEMGTSMFVSENQPMTFYKFTLKTVEFIFPPHAFTMTLDKVTNVARYKAAGLSECYWCTTKNGPGRGMIILIAQFIVYMSLVILTQYGFIGMLYEKIVNRWYETPPLQYHDEMAAAERTYVDKAITLPKKQIPDTMLVHRLHKRYFRLFKKSCNAVKGISFSVKRGECFGVLGANGAGKSTTFSMLTGAASPTRGSALANGHDMAPYGQYLHSISYCPQFFGLDDFLTGEENLTLLLTMRGLTSEDVKSEVKTWIEIIGLERYAARAVRAYSGGCARRLGAAGALAAGAPLTLLDEPSAGVDTAARRRLWAAVRAARAARRAVIVTSHSMDEMEALCARIAIVSRGEVCALGGAGALRAQHAAGHALRLKLRPRTAELTDVTDSATDGSKQGHEADLMKLKSDLQRNFNCELKDEHKTMLHYHINETVRYSELFSKLEQLRTSHPTLEDYSISETTLEEVFLAFAKENEPAEV